MIALQVGDNDFKFQLDNPTIRKTYFTSWPAFTKAAHRKVKQQPSDCHGFLAAIISIK